MFNFSNGDRVVDKGRLGTVSHLDNAPGWAVFTPDFPTDDGLDWYVAPVERLRPATCPVCRVDCPPDSFGMPGACPECGGWRHCYNWDTSRYTDADLDYLPARLPDGMTIDAWLDTFRRSV